MSQNLPTFSSPVASQKRWTRNKRKCSFGSLEKPSRRQFTQQKNNVQENRIVSSKFNDSLDSDIDFSSPINWADEVEREEKLIYTENARRKYKQDQRAKKQLNMDKQDKRITKKNVPTKESKTLKPIMNDPHRLSQRQKQIDMGKNTLGYEMYLEHLTRNERTSEDPWTPDKYQQCSTRSWQGQMKIWRRRLHMWDPEEQADGIEDPFAVSTSEFDGKEVEPSSSDGSSQTSDYGSIQANSSFDDNELFGYFDSQTVVEANDHFPL